MNENKRINRNGIGFFGLLTIVFITLKLTNYIDWSWIWVLSPLWMPMIAVIVFAIFYCILVVFIGVFIVVADSIFSNKKK